MTTPSIEEIMREFERFTIMDGNRISLHGEAERAETWLRTLLEKKDAECFCKDKGVIEMIEEAKNEIIEKGWEYIVKATREGSWSKKEYIEALQDKK